MGKRISKILIVAIVLLHQLQYAGIASAGSFNLISDMSSDANHLVSPMTSDTKSFSFEKMFSWSNRVPEDSNSKESLVAEDPKIEYIVIGESIRQVTAYNVGDVHQTDDTPCIGAYTKVNLCDEIAKGVRVCAANFVPKETMLRIFTDDGESFECVVWDRMHSRFKTRVDIAMSKSEKSQARQFGLQKLKVQILEKVEDKVAAI